MDKWWIIVLMIFLHIVDDYYLQGWLASAKQNQWWKDNAPDEKYKYDYIWALIMHSFSWSFMIMLPIAGFLDFKLNVLFLGMLVCNLLVHAITDNAKANKRYINLWQDQLVHMCQIVITFAVFCK